MSKLAKREGPDPVEPVSIGGIRFGAIHWGSEVSSAKNGGFISATDSASNAQLWVLRIYEIAYDPKRERDVQDVFITNLRVDEHDKLIVENELGRKYTVDPKTRAVKSH